MENKSSISSSKYISSTLDNVTLNSNIFITQMKEALNILDSAALSIIIPILKIQNKITKKFDILTKEYKEMKEKQETENNENTTHSEESKSDTTNNNENQVSKNDKNIEKIINFIQNVRNNIDLFNKLSNSEVYENIIKSFNELIPDHGMFIERNKTNINPNNSNTNNNEGEKKDINKNQNENSIQNNNSNHKKILNKKKRPLRRISGVPRTNNAEINKILNKEVMKGNEKKEQPHPYIPSTPNPYHNKEYSKKQQKEIDLLNMIQRDYPTNSYIQRISKTFLSRRLYKKVMYQHVFNYYENGYIDDKKVKTVGESASYKNCKATFKFSGDKIQNTEKLDEMMGKELRQEFAKIDEEKNEYILAGKIGCTIYELIERVFRKNLLKEASVVNATLEFYEFYEELVSEFNEKEKNVRIIFCDEIILRHLREDWKNLQMCRDYVRKKKLENVI